MLNSLNRQTVESAEEIEEMLAIQNEGKLSEKANEPIPANGPAQMLSSAVSVPMAALIRSLLSFPVLVENSSV